MLKKWTWIHTRTELPDDYILFNLDFVLDNQQVDDFGCLGDLTTAPTLDLGCVFKVLPKPGARACKPLAEAIGKCQPKRIWKLLSRYRIPSQIHLRRGETTNPLTLLLQSPYLVDETSGDCPRAMEMLLAARCSPSEMGSPMQSPLLFAVGSNDHESVEDLLIAFTPWGREPPICVAVRHRIREVTRTLLHYRADLTARGFSVPPPGCEASRYEGPTLTELSAGD